MSLVYADRVQETSTTTGTGTYTLAGAVLGSQSFAAVGDGNTCYYCAIGVDGNGNPNADGWEVGLGTYTLAGTTLARTTVLASSNGGAAVNWPAGTRRIFVDLPATDVTGTGTGSLVRATSPTLVTPVLGTPASGDASNLTNIPVNQAKSGAVLPVANGGAIWTTVIAASDQDIPSNTTPTNDNELFFDMAANGVYEFEAIIAYSSPAGAGTPDFKYTFNGPATLTGGYVGVHVLSTADAQGGYGSAALGTASTLGTAATPRLFRVFGWGSSTGGGVGASGLILQWAQNTSGVNATRRHAGSLLQYRRIL